MAVLSTLFFKIENRIGLIVSVVLKMSSPSQITINMDKDCYKVIKIEDIAAMITTGKIPLQINDSRNFKYTYSRDGVNQIANIVFNDDRDLFRVYSVKTSRMLDNFMPIEDDYSIMWCAIVDGSELTVDYLDEMKPWYKEN